MIFGPGESMSDIIQGNSMLTYAVPTAEGYEQQ